MKHRLLAYLLLFLIACGEAKDNINKAYVHFQADTSIKNKKEIKRDLPAFEKAHANAKRIMADKFYFIPADHTAPFGNDDGADAYCAFKDWRQTHKTNELREFLFKQIDQWGYPKFDIAETNIEKLKPYLLQRELGSRLMSGIDAATIAIAFGQLYLEGTIDKDFKEIAKTAVKRQLIPDLLAYWGEPDKTDREAKLKKMLAALNHLN